MRAPSTILMTADTVGGVWTYALELCGALRDFDIHVVLATMGAPLSFAQRREVALLDNVEVAQSAFRLEWMNEPWRDIEQAGDWLIELQERFHPEIIHLNGYAHSTLRWQAPVLVVAHSCVLSWWRAVRGAEAPSEWRRYAEAVGSGLNSADMVVAPTQAFLSELEGLYGPLPNATVIPNGRRGMAAPSCDKEPFILSGGRLWDEAKNIMAVASVALHLPWPVCVAGDDVHPNGSRARFAGVKCLGRLASHEFAAWLNRASIFALPARYEPFGLAPLEAALAGCALVLGDIPTLREVWGDAAIFVDPSDHRQLRAALARLIAEPELRTRLARAAQRRAMTLTPERMASRYVNAYASLLLAQTQEASTLCVS